MSIAGKHTARATEATLGRASTGTEQVAVAFEVIGGEHAGARITWYGYFSERAAKRTIEALRHCGWQGDDLSDLRTVGSRECQIDVEVDENGRDKVKWVNASGGASQKDPMSPDEAKAFARRMYATVRAVSAPAAPAPAQPRQPRQPSQHERAKTNGYQSQGDAFEPPPADDVPF